MREVKIQLEVLTPMFSSGGNPNKAEFRITELKAMMRTTFRELYSFKDLKDIKLQEEKFFGSTAIKSPITLLKESVEIMGKREEFLLPHKSILKRECLNIGTSITISMVGNNDVNLNFYIKLLLQASMLGGLGKRSRKGFGSFKITKIIDKNQPKISADDYAEWLEQPPIGIFQKPDEFIKLRPFEKRDSDQSQSMIFKDFNENTRLKFPYIKKITLIVIKNDIKELLKQISQLTHDRLNPEFVDKKNVKDFKKKYRSVLGNCGESLKRFASPIYCTLFANSNNKYLVIKELNYDYIIPQLENKKNHNNNSLTALKAYINKYILRLKEIAKGE